MKIFLFFLAYLLAYGNGTQTSNKTQKARAKWNKQRARNITTTLLPKLYATKEKKRKKSETKQNKGKSIHYMHIQRRSHYKTIANRRTQKGANNGNRNSNNHDEENIKSENKQSNERIPTMWYVRMLQVYMWGFQFKQMQTIHCLCLLKQNPAHTEWRLRAHLLTYTHTHIHPHMRTNKTANSRARTSLNHKIKLNKKLA